MLKEVKLSGRTILILIIYLMQYVVMVGYPMVTGDTSLTFKLMGCYGSDYLYLLRLYRRLLLR